MEEIKQGYKQTDIGVIPEDWEVKTVFDIAPLQRGFDLPINNISDGLYPVVFSNGILKSHKEYKVKGPGVVTGRSGTIGKLFYVAKDFWPHNTTLWVTNFKGNSPMFVYYLFNRLDFGSLATGSGVPTLNRNDIHELKIAIPNSKIEQTAITTTLSDTDVLIAALGKKIAKKQQIKQGAMQQLLTGKKRLPGFSGEWVEKTVGSVCIVKRGQMIVSSEFVTGSIPVIAGGMSPAGYHNASNRNENTITISASGANAGFIGFHKFPIFASDCSTINENENIDIHFIYYTLKLKQEEIYKCQTGGAQPHIHPKDIEPLILNFPTDKPEQTAIAQILTDMDNEIVQLEKERDKYKELKAGMMQVLLTGKVRLV